jgi:hypothetical protein
MEAEGARRHGRLDAQRDSAAGEARGRTVVFTGGGLSAFAEMRVYSEVDPCLNPFRP